MERYELELKIKRAVEHATPDVLEQILSRCGEARDTVFLTDEIRATPKRKPRSHLFLAAAAALVLVGGLMLFPTGSGAVQAEEAGTQATLKVQPILSVALDAAVQLEVTPTEEGSFSASSARLEVSTNNETGYSLYLATANGESTLKSLNPATTAKVQAVTGEVTATRFGANTWGYNLGQAATEETIYQAVPTTTGEPQVTTTGPTIGDGTVAADVYSLNFGAKVDADLPSGTYGNEVVVSVVTNPEYVPTLSRISNMQDITPEICAKSAENETARLMDKRDNKLYWVTKLADGNCWMTQNLDYDIPAGGLTSDDSDINNASGVWNSSSAYAPQATSTDIKVMGNKSDTGTYSWDPGMYVKTTPTDWNKYCDNVSGYDDPACVKAGWTNVSTMTAMTEERTDGVVTNGNTYDAHYLVGNFYQWNAATAGSGGTITSGELNDFPAALETNLVSAEDSICPKGWELPKFWGNTSFINLFSQYSSDDTSNIFTGLTTETMSGTINGGKIATSPLYLQYSGDAGMDGVLKGAGAVGDFWSSTASSDPSRAFGLSFLESEVYVLFDTFRARGFSIRCLAPSV